MDLTIKEQNKELTLSIVLKEEVERTHRGGVNSLQFDPLLNQLYSAGRDGVIKKWNCQAEERYVMSMEQHFDWVNDIVLCNGGKNLISASSDKTIKVWSTEKRFCISTLTHHKDYVKSLAYAKDRERVASAGLDSNIFLWDVNTLTSDSNANPISSLNGKEHSIYSIAMNPSGEIIVSGGIEHKLRVWDVRSGKGIMKLKGHSFIVKALLLDHDGRFCLSGSSDGKIKLWCLRQQLCISTINAHTGSVWALWGDDSFSHVISGAKDGEVYMTDLDNPQRNVLICKETASVLKIVKNPEKESLWVATVSGIKNWALPKNNGSEIQDEYLQTPYNKDPEVIIQSNPTVIQEYAVLNDKRHFLAKDTEMRVMVYDVLKACKVEDLGAADFNLERSRRFKRVYIPSWFTVNLKTGVPTIELQLREEDNCFSAWVSAEEAGLTPHISADKRVNYGTILLQELLKNWLRSLKAGNGSAEHQEQSNKSLEASDYLSVPGHIPLLFSDANGRIVGQMLVRDAGGETEGAFLRENLPSWIIDVLLEKTLPDFNTIPFFLQPHFSSRFPDLTMRRMHTNDFVKASVIAVYAHNRLKTSGCGSALMPGSSSSGTEETDPNSQETHSIPGVELLCKDEVLDSNMSIRTVKHFIWNSESDLVLHYRDED